MSNARQPSNLLMTQLHPRRLPSLQRSYFALIHGQTAPWMKVAGMGTTLAAGSHLWTKPRNTKTYPDNTHILRDSGSKSEMK